MSKTKAALKRARLAKAAELVARRKAELRDPRNEYVEREVSRYMAKRRRR